MPIPLPPPEPKPFVKPVGEFAEPMVFETEEKALAAKLKYGGRIEKNFIKGKGYFLLFPKKI